MPTLVQFGAGNIGRGFIAPTFAGAGWSVVFVDVAPALVEGLRARGAYRVRLVDNQGERVQEVRGVSVVDGRDTAAVAAAVAACDLAATAVGLAVLPRLGAPIAAGLARRDRPLDVLVCENGATAHEQLRAAVLAADPALGDRLGCVRTSIGRMIPPPAPGEDPVDIRVEPYACLPVERTAFRGPLPQVPNLKPAGDFDLVLAQKLYLHNLTHACLAYGGHLRGYATIPDCAEDDALVARARAAAAAVAAALGRRHGGEAEAECLAIADDLFKRYRNRALADPVARVARDPWRKLAADDRLVGAARLCRAQGVAMAPIAAAIADACRYAPAADEPRAAEWLALTPAARLAAAAQLTPEDPIMTATAKQLQKAGRAAQAAAQMRAAGLSLRDEEAAAIEIADFGLGRYEQFGLAIHVYVNTKRCCAKELMMLPGQSCPEHRHPPVDGELGKEETFRVRQGEVFLHLAGDFGEAEKAAALARLPADKRDTVTVFRTVHLKPGDQATLGPNVKHWFTAGPQGAVVSEFSTRSRDEADIFTDAAIVRCPEE
jgi:mannitol-1-phosphate 5-dehydrogenase